MDKFITWMLAGMIGGFVGGVMKYVHSLWIII